jgi:hypothetical protein
MRRTIGSPFSNAYGSRAGGPPMRLQSRERNEIYRLINPAGLAVWLSMPIPYRFDNNKVAEYIALQRLDMLPTAPEIQLEL